MKNPLFTEYFIYMYVCQSIKFEFMRADGSLQWDDGFFRLVPWHCFTHICNNWVREGVYEGVST